MIEVSTMPKVIKVQIKVKVINAKSDFLNKMNFNSLIMVKKATFIHKKNVPLILETLKKDPL